MAVVPVRSLSPEAPAGLPDGQTGRLAPGLVPGLVPGLAPTTTALLHEVIDRSPVGIAVIDFDGHYLIVNPAYAALYGYEPQQMQGASFLLVFPRDQHERVLGLHQRFLSQGGELRGEWDVVRRDGTMLCTLSESVRIPGQRGPDARLVYVLDISERKRSELALREAHQFSRSVLDGLSAHVCVLDESGRIVSVNRAWREFAEQSSGSPQATQVGADYLQVCQQAATSDQPGAESAGRMLDLLREVLSGARQQFELEYPCHAPDQQRWFVVKVNRMDSGSRTWVVVAHNDVTPLKQAQQRLLAKQGLLADLAASIPGVMFRLQPTAQQSWRFSYLSPGVEELFGLTVDAVLCAPDLLRRAILESDLPAFDASWQMARQHGAVWEREVRIRTPQGTQRWLHVLARPKAGPTEEEVWTGVFTDVSERKAVEAALLQREETFRTLFETVPQGIVYHDVDGSIKDANPAAQRILGLSLPQLRASSSCDGSWHAVREDGSDFPGEEHPAMQALRTGRPVSGVVMGLPVPGRGFAWLEVSAQPIFRAGRLVEVYASFEDITERVLLSQELKHQAATDYLTGAANRRAVMERLALEFERAKRSPQLQCSVLALDLDLFKAINDQWGHAAGDAVLRQVTRAMRQLTRLVDLIGRSGGEEFTVVLPDTGPEEARVLAERLRLAVAEQSTLHDGVLLKVTVSVGVSTIAAEDGSIDAVLTRADKALYQVKHAGRNAVRVLLA